MRRLRYVQQSNLAIPLFKRNQGGVHIKDRGNAAIPTDIVKVLKTQDENYVRIMRLSNLKVRNISRCMISIHLFSRKSTTLNAS